MTATCSKRVPGWLGRMTATRGAIVQIGDDHECNDDVDNDDDDKEEEEEEEEKEEKEVVVEMMMIMITM
ncbi:hypothetical protein ElyMa_006142900 [Elysia marginata]|uniref:Uncharacterized protein n=1 Tax=Elysia marginata TaxID=1093978 RepID=A0AAV4GYA0_9GAST|nr:hypothetical protein ElyMa_006142900 [Elysia marginata]